MVLISMALYIRVGIEIVKRRRALMSITHGGSSVQLDDTVVILQPTRDSFADSSATGDGTKSDYLNSPTLYHGSTSHSTGNGSVHTAISTHPLSGPQKSSLSFRQYILMPLFFFLALLTVWVAPTTNRVAQYVDPSFGSFPLLCVVGTTGSLRGFWNSLVFLIVGMKSRKRRKDLEAEGVVRVVRR